MVYKRKSISKMAAAAAAAAWVHKGENGHTDAFFAALDTVILAVHDVPPEKAPAHAAKIAKDQNGTDAMCTAIAAGVAAAAVGWEFKVVQKVSRAASRAFTKNENRPPAAIAEAVSKAVRAESSRYPAVQSAAAAAYAAHVSQHSAASVYRAPLHGANNGGVGGGIGRTADTPAIGDDDAAVAAAEAAGKAAKSKKSPHYLSYAAAAAARAATFRGANQCSVFKAALEAATEENTTLHTNASATNSTCADARHPDDLLAEHVALAITAAAFENKPDKPTFEACREELLEEIPNSHELIVKKLETIVALDTFLAAFLLFSLTGRKKEDEGEVHTEEVVQTVLQAYAFAVFLAATLSAGLFLVVTGGTFALTRNDLIIPTLLSTIGFFLLLVTVADAVFLELGEGVYYDDGHAPLFWTTVIIGFLIQVFCVCVAVFCTVRGSKYRWHVSWKAWPTARRVEHSGKGCFTGCCRSQ